MEKVDEAHGLADQLAESSMTMAAEGTSRRRSLAALLEMDKKDEVPSLADAPVKSSVIKPAEGTTTRRRRLAAKFMETEKGAQILGSSSHSKPVLEQSRSAAAEEAERDKVMGLTCGSWVVDIEKLIEDTDLSVESARWNKKFIYRAPEFVKRFTVRDAYEPQMVSLGPMHHGKAHLMPMEEHKRRAVVHLVKRSKKPLWQFLRAIHEVADDVAGAYNDLDEEWRSNKPRLVQMLLTDGCFLLESMQIAILLDDGDDYAIKDPIFSVEMFKKQWPQLRNDMICLENQIPLIILYKIQLTLDQGTSAVQSSKALVNLMIHNFLNVPVAENGGDNGLHILDILHRSYCGRRPIWEELEGYVLSVPCATELHNAGVQFTKGKPKCIHDVDFVNGILTMPNMEFDENARIIFLNMLAYEWVVPETERDIATYIGFLGKIVQSERDLSFLRANGIFNNTGSDKKVVDMIKTISALSWFPEAGSRMGHMQFKIDSYYKKRSNTWRAIFKKRYLSNPWVFISLLVAVLYFAESGLQTLYAVLAYYLPHQG